VYGCAHENVEDTSGCTIRKISLENLHQENFIGKPAIDIGAMPMDGPDVNCRFSNEIEKMMNLKQIWQM